MTKAVISGDREPCTGFFIFIFFVCVTAVPTSFEQTLRDYRLRAGLFSKNII